MSDSSSISFGICSDKLSVITDNFLIEESLYGVAESVFGDSESSFDFYCDNSFSIGDFGTIYISSKLSWELSDLFTLSISSSSSESESEL